ncbi:sigma-54 interaction domain-containing protein [Desulfolutivibrio sulfoxidireducens]|nr:sigma-54 dependent transcriptional regulator [Desulfolutivibrio sulfoxidireducens]QLA18003.1 sigma-54-dependent Fis family transcriptional regulator [Desulfolutivibrio sulfoxidireducens]
MLGECKRLFEANQPGCRNEFLVLFEKLELMVLGVLQREKLLGETVERLDASHTELKALEQRLKRENTVLKQQLRRRFSVGKVIGSSPKMANILRLAQRVAETTVNVLITGETGTGKEMVAKVVHYSGQRRHGPFMAVNCTAVPDTLFESEFFGIEKGVATGVEKRRGLIEGSRGGTLFLDEIGDMSMASQSKILRVLELGEVTPVGARETVPVDIRLVCATNRDLARDIEDGRFRRDLYYRVKVVHLDLPPLRERKDDILLLAESFLTTFAHDMARGRMAFSRAAREALREYHWPGNIRELENEVERAVALAYSSKIYLDDLSEEIRGRTSPVRGPDPGLGAEPTPPSGRLKRLERDAILACLAECGGNRTRAARMLGISRESLRRKLKGNGADASAQKDEAPS